MVGEAGTGVGERGGVYSGLTPRPQGLGVARGSSGLSSGSGRTAEAVCRGCWLSLKEREWGLSLGFGDTGSRRTTVGGARGEELVACRGVGSAGPFRGCMQGAQPCPGGCGPIGQVWPYPGGPGLTGQRRPLSGSSALRGPVLLTPSPPLGPGGAAAPAPSLALDLGAGVDQVSFTQIPWAWAQEGGHGSVT